MGVVAHFEMHVRSAGPSGFADARDHLAALHLVPFLTRLRELCAYTVVRLPGCLMMIIWPYPVGPHPLNSTVPPSAARMGVPRRAPISMP